MTDRDQCGSGPHPWNTPRPPDPTYRLFVQHDKIDGRAVDVTAHGKFAAMLDLAEQFKPLGYILVRLELEAVADR
jgi:hypothetical protein